MLNEPEDTFSTILFSLNEEQALAARMLKLMFALLQKFIPPVDSAGSNTAVSSIDDTKFVDGIEIILQPITYS